MPFDGERAFSWAAMTPKHGETADPAANTNPAEVTVTKRTLLLGGYNIFVAAVAAADRIEQLVIKNNGTDVSRYLNGPAAITSGQTVIVNLSQGPSAVRTTASVHDLGIDIGGIELPIGAKFQLTYQNKNAADDAGKFFYTYKEVP